MLQPNAGQLPVVLVVEDEFLVRMDAIEVIEGGGFEVVEAKNADDAIAILEQRNDIVLISTDIDMPGSMDGLKLAHFVKIVGRLSKSSPRQVTGRSRRTTCPKAAALCLSRITQPRSQTQFIS